MRQAGRSWKRGMTLILALFVTFLLSTLSLAFVTLMMEDSRGGRSSSWQVMAAEGAEWGIQTSLSYMGRGGNWQPAFDPERLAFYDLLNASQPNGPVHLVASSGGSGEVHVLIEAGSEGETAARRLRLVDPSLPMGAVLSLDDELLARIEVEVKPAQVPLSSFGPGQAAQYLLTSRAELFRKEDAELENPIPVAVSVLEAQVRPDVETTALFQVQNLRSWDVQGGGLGNANLADKILIPAQFESAGSVRVTGVDPFNPNAPWRDYAGNVRFENPNSPNMVFKGQLSVAELNNVDASGNPVSSGNAQSFPGGVVFGADYTPLPDPRRYLNYDKNGDGLIDGGAAPGPGSLGGSDQEWGLLAVAATTASGGGGPHGSSVKGYYKVDKALIKQANELHPRLPDPGSSIPLDKQDYRPAVPEVQVILKDGGFIEVNVWETGFGDGGFSGPEGNLNSVASATMGNLAGPLGTTFHVSQLDMGVLYVEGGQVVVQSEMTNGVPAEFEGRLQIVAAEDASRRATVDVDGELNYANPATSIYHQAAAEFFEWQKTRLTLDPDDPDYTDGSGFKAPPYTTAQLLQAAEAGHISDTTGLSLAAADAPFWPPPNANVEREGNLVVASDILKKDGSASVLGLTAENFILLGDRTQASKAVPNELTVEGVLTSFEHSLQLDWDNTSNNRTTNAEGVKSNVATSTPGFNGKISLKGSMLAPFSNVEGDLAGRGYPRQQFLHDQDLERWAPPFQPRTLLSEYPNDQITIGWTIISFTDRTSLGVRVE
jgi:hypothetical protein